MRTLDISTQKTLDTWQEDWGLRKFGLNVKEIAT
jgi:hypothetical protein